MSGNISRSTNQGLQFYQNNHPSMVQSWSGDAAGDSTTVVTTTNTSVSHQFSRVTRPITARRRSRASRRTPTTVLTTDTANFRAMVQRFTGGESSGSDTASGPFLSNQSTFTSSTHQFLNTYNSNSSGFSDGVGSISTRSVGLRPDDRYNLQLPPSHSQQYFTMTVDYGGSSTAHGDDDQDLGFRQRGSYNW